MGILDKRQVEITAARPARKTILSALACDLESQAWHAISRPFPRFGPLKLRHDTKASAPPATSCM
ncbi:hypothetical protein [Burkholderia ubonensis]|uniref:hypothetical protein n=1 Tax=Burkholderia ubonensis TaxID=101571 RepID=UPI0018AD221B|nr:hypothetical protein [Burkholderia ubonensis]